MFRSSNLSFANATKIKNQIFKLNESITIIKLFKVKSIEIDEAKQIMEIVIEIRPIKPRSIVNSLKYIIEILNELKTENYEDLTFKNMKFWYFFQC